jgi:SsrA-binding protein
MAVPHEKSFKRLADNRKAFRDYEVLERLEAGIQLCGTEVKSVRASGVQLAGGYARLERGEVFVYNINIAPYDFGNRFNHAPERPRKLLLHGKEIRRLQTAIEQKGHTVVPLSIYLKRGIVKMEIGICRGKTLYDKRETVRRKTADREAERAIAAHSRGR